MAFSNGMKYMFVAILFFQGTGISVKELGHIPFTEVVFFRALFSLIFCAIILLYQKKSLLGHNKKLLLARGLAGTIALTLYFYTIHNMPLGTAVAIQYMSPIFTLVLAGWLVGEKVERIQWLFFAMAIAGVIMVKGFDSRVTLFELIIGVTAAIASGFSYNYIRKLRSTDEPLVVVFYFPLVTVPLIGPFAYQDWVQPIGEDWLWVFGVGFFTLLAQFFMTKSLQLDRAEFTGIVRYVGVICSVLIGYYFYDETLGFLSLVGVGLIILSLATSTVYRYKTARR